MKIIQYICAIVLISMTQSLTAQVFRDRLEKQGTRNEIRKSKKQLERDLEEKESFINLIQEFKIAYLSMDESAAGSVKSSILTDMDREIDHSRRKASEANQEIRQSMRELEGSHRDIEQSSTELSLALKKRWDARRDYRDDRRDHRDELKDLEDDRADLDIIEKRLMIQERTREHFADWSVVAETGDIESEPAVKMLHAFLRTLEDDLAGTEEELAEDKIELREDRRELREDRRERREQRKERRVDRQYHRYH